MVNQISNIGSESAYCNDLNNMEHHVPFRRSVYFINATSEDIVIVHRNNLPVFVRKATNGVIQNKNFIVRTIYRFNGMDSVVDTINMITAYQKSHGSNNTELEIVRDMLSKAFDNNRHNCLVEVAIDNMISSTDITKLKSCYCPQVDLMIASKDYHPHVPHPYSVEGRTLQQFRDMGGHVKHSGVVIELIDNERKYGKRFIRIGKDYMEIDPIEDKTRPSAAYITHITHKDDTVLMTPVVMSMPDAQNNLGLYPTLEQAISDDQAEQLGKKQLLIAQTELEKLKAGNGIELEQLKKETEIHRSAALQRERELAEVKQQYEAELLEGKQKAAKAEAELKSIKMEHEQMKENINQRSAMFDEIIRQNSKLRDDYYESRSSTRKDTNELVKMASVVLLTGLSVWAALRKQQS